MDIVSRIKTFMNCQQISSSQFADNCKIPRPTVSQILNGRNKKISDEIIAKIHSAYSNLSMMWLMFGEGEMLINPNIETSEGENQPSLDFDDVEKSENDIVAGQYDFEFDESENTEKKFSINFEEPNQLKTPIESVKADIEENKGDNTTADGEKKIMHIMIFYSDNSYEVLYPGRK